MLLSFIVCIFNIFLLQSIFYLRQIIYFLFFAEFLQQVLDADTISCLRFYLQFFVYFHYFQLFFQTFDSKFLCHIEQWALYFIGCSKIIYLLIVLYQRCHFTQIFLYVILSQYNSLLLLHIFFFIYFILVSLILIFSLGYYNFLLYIENKYI